MWQVVYPECFSDPILYASKDDACQDQCKFVLELLYQEIDDDFDSSEVDEDLLSLALVIYTLAHQNKFVEAMDKYDEYYDGKNRFFEISEVKLSSPDSIPIIDWSKFEKFM